MKRSEMIFKAIDNMSVKELKMLVNSTRDEFKPYLRYIKNTLDLKTIRTKFLTAA